MDFKSSYRMEAVYFQKLKSDIDIVKSLMNDGNTEEARALLENAVDVNGAVLLLYRNLGDVWGELGAQIQKTNDTLKELKETTDKYHEELNEKIDDVNNTIIRLLNALEDRIAAVERDLATMSRVKILSLVNENNVYHIYDGTTEIDFAALSDMVEFPHDVIVRGVVNGEETVFQLREFDTDETSGSFEFYSTGLENNVVNDITVTVLSDDSVNVVTDIQTMKEYTSGNGINISSDDEISVDFDVVQEKLTAGSGISIDPDSHEISATGGESLYPLNTLAQLHYQQFNSAAPSDTNGVFRNTDTTSKLVNKAIDNDTLRVVLHSGLRHGGGVTITDGKHIIGNVNYMLTLTFLIDGLNKPLVLSGNMLNFDINTNQEYGLIFEKEFYFNFSGVKGCTLRYITLNKYSGCIDTDDTLLTLNSLAQDAVKNLRVEIYN